MAKHLKIKTESDNDVHFNGVFDDHTLCGLDTNGDSHLRIGIPIEVKTKVNCKQCISLISYCYSIKKSEWIN